MNEKELGKLMHVLSIENKYSSKLYHYIEDLDLMPIECDTSELNLSKLNKHEFGLLKQINFDDFLLREMIEEEKTKRNGNKNKVHKERTH